jgi:hypothetical protein
MAPLQTKADVSRITSTPPPSELRSDPRWRLIERILLSAPFQKSANLHGLLSFLAEHSILDKAEALTERQIGIGVFGKPADYSPAEDSAVRVHIRQLRLRIHEYFAQDGRYDTLRVDIPKGSYALEFHESLPEIIAEPPRPAPLPEPPKLRSGHTREVLGWTALVAAVVCAVGWYRSANPSPRFHVPWPLNAIVQQSRPTRIVVSDGNLCTIRPLASNEVTLEQYLQPGFVESLTPAHLDPKLSKMMTYVASSELTSFADVAVASALVKLAGPESDQIALSSARSLDRRDLEKGNYIFVGSATSNPWVTLFYNQLNFQMVEEGIGGRMFFRNRHPQPGEQAEYEGLAHTGSTGEDYATISVLPGEMGQGNVMILQGLRQEGTEALSVLLSDADDRARLEQAVRKNSKSDSPYFEALVRSQAVAGAPVSVDIVAVRTILP